MPFVPTAGPNDVRQVTFNIADPSGFLDLSSLCFQWTVTNTHATNAMQPLSAVGSRVSGQGSRGKQQHQK